MLWLEEFSFAPVEQEEQFLNYLRPTCYDTFYPFMIFPQKGFRQIDFEDITILYGGNGSGKSTALNLIANKIEAERDTVYNRSNFFEDYLVQQTAGTHYAYSKSQLHSYYTIRENSGRIVALIAANMPKA